MEFLFENPLLIFLLIGLISSFLKKAKGEKEQEQQPKRPAQPTGTERTGPTSTSESTIPKQASVDTNKESAKGQVQGQWPKHKPQVPLSDIQKKYEERRELEKQRTVPKVVQERPINKQVPTGKIVNEESSLQLKPDADRLIEGIAWSQVLGEPRSKRPHRTMKRY